ncbi:hypothetical protein C8J57DRAFT_1275887 [Mycena rebaudengoi]|nr:hypothetical protein C8J57DRAFT_1275887 [Mycena rebaudengoi]
MPPCFPLPTRLFLVASSWMRRTVSIDVPGLHRSELCYISSPVCQRSFHSRRSVGMEAEVWEFGGDYSAALHLALGANRKKKKK